MLRIIRSIFNFKIILGAVIFGVGIFTVLLAILWSSKAQEVQRIPGTAMLQVIEAPTETPLVPITTPTSTPEVTPTQPIPSGGGDIALADYVQVSGTGGDGLRLHTSAGVSSQVDYVAIDSEVLLVKDGPIDMDGYIWWQLQEPYTNKVLGWGVSNYLVVVQNP